MVIVYDNQWFYLPCSSQFRMSQNYVDKDYSTRTIHNSLLVKTSVVNEKINASFEASIYASSNKVENFLFNWLGFSNVGNEYSLQNTGSVPKKATVFILNTEKAITIRDIRERIYGASGDGIDLVLTDCVLEELTITFEKGILGYSIRGTGIDMNVTDSLVGQPLPSVLNTQQGFVGFKPYSVNVDYQNNTTSYDKPINGVITINKEIDWLNQKTIHNTLSNGIYTPNNSVLKGLSVTGYFSVYAKEYTFRHYEAGIEMFYGDKVFYTSPVSITERLDMDQLYTVSSDFKLTGPQSTVNFIL